MYECNLIANEMAKVHVTLSFSKETDGNMAKSIDDTIYRNVDITYTYTCIQDKKKYLIKNGSKFEILIKPMKQYRWHSSRFQPFYDTLFFFG